MGKSTVGCVQSVSMPQCGMDSECEAVHLEPFVHQVGGHSVVLSFDAHTLCKPLISREHHFYKTMPDNIREFTPEYRGVVEVTFQEDADGYVNFIAHPVEEGDSYSKKQSTCYSGNSPSSGGDTAQSDSDSETSSVEQTPQKHRFRLKRSGSIEIEPQPSSRLDRVGSQQLSPRLGPNPWTLQCHKQHLTKMNKDNADNGTHKFILLEDLASQFTSPCILDLKMGTRQHGDDSSEEKRQHHMRKCEQSTSSTLGVRVCGMQVYQVNSGRFVFHDKYFGRQLTVQGFSQSLYQFLHNGQRLREELIDEILSRLETLQHSLTHQETFRFYSSSLLIMYEGQTDSQSHPSSDNLAAGSSQGYPSPSSSFPAAGTSSSVACDQHLPESRPGEVQAASSHTENCNLDTSYPLVDIRMIDFAHVTHQGFHKDDLIHPGPDQGYLLGLQNLVSDFHRLKAINSQRDEIQS